MHCGDGARTYRSAALADRKAHPGLESNRAPEGESNEGAAAGLEHLTTTS